METALTHEELRTLSEYAQDFQRRNVPLATRAKLEKLGLLMSGRGPIYVVTGAGRQLLAEWPLPSPETREL